jgi:pimeloyl-ACP methyl ester carboxylesterase
MRVDANNLVYVGHSLGTAIAAELAAFSPPRTLVLQAPFSSARDMGRRMLVPGVGLFWRVVSRVHFNTIERVKALNVPVWVTHGDNDFVIPVRMGREVHAAARVKGDLLIIPGAGHNDVAEVGGREYWAWLSRAVAAGRPLANPAAREETRSEP